MINSIIPTTGITLSSLLLCSLVSIVLGLIIGYTYMKTSKYSKNFITTLCLLPILVQIVMMMVNGDLGTSVAIVGAFSLIRFRSMPGTSKEIVSVFFAMAIGLATGTGYLIFAIIVTIIIEILIILLNKYGFKNISKTKILKIVVPEDLNYTNIFDDVFEKYNVEAILQKTKTTNLGSLFELTYDIKYNNDINEKEFLDLIRIKNGNLNISLMDNDLESEML